MVRRRWRRMPMEVRREVMRLAAAGLSEKQIMEQVDISGGIWCVLAPLGGVIRKEAFGGPSGVRLSVEERQELWLGLQSGRSLREIALFLLQEVTGTHDRLGWAGAGDA